MSEWRKLREKERGEFDAELKELITENMRLKAELRDLGASLRKDIKKKQERIERLAVVLRRGEIEDSDPLNQIQLVEAS